MFEVLVLTEASTQEMLTPSNHCFLLNNKYHYSSTGRNAVIIRLIHKTAQVCP